MPTKKNNYKPPKMVDPRTAYITAACGKCLECRRQKQREWLVRMREELRTKRNAYFMTLTISDENYQILKNTCKSEDENTIATKAIRLMLERIRKKNREIYKTLVYHRARTRKDRELTFARYRDWETDRKSTRLNSSHITRSRMPSSA